MIDYQARSLPANYTSYFLEDLVDEVTQNNFSLNNNPNLEQDLKKATIAKTLFYIGEF